VDIAMSVEGVLMVICGFQKPACHLPLTTPSTDKPACGAGRIGAGLGGCISVLIEKDKADDLRRKVSEEYTVREILKRQLKSVVKGLRALSAN
jgi:hypothetical protein